MTDLDDASELAREAIDNLAEMEEEQEIGASFLKTVVANLGRKTLTDWMTCKEHEVVLAPVRLPKGMMNQIKAMDEAGMEHTALGKYDNCSAKADCPILLRNPSEILLTVLLKVAFSHCSAVIDECKGEGGS